MINCSPIGRACSQTERDAFEQYDKGAQVRPKMVEALKVTFNDCFWVRNWPVKSFLPKVSTFSCEMFVTKAGVSWGMPGGAFQETDPLLWSLNEICLLQTRGSGLLLATRVATRFLQVNHSLRYFRSCSHIKTNFTVTSLCFNFSCQGLVFFV